MRFCLIRLVVGGWGGEAQLGALGTAATDWFIVPSPCDYDDGEFGGMKIGRGNRSTRRKPAPALLTSIPDTGSSLTKSFCSIYHFISC
jgi:hypothetical protein